MFLDEILQSVDDRVARLLSVKSYLLDEAEAMPPVRSLANALTDGVTTPAVIAECKHRSPSKGWFTEHYDPVSQASRYQVMGASAISVLTEPHFFAGELVHLQAVRSHVGLPVLRKDFVRHEVQLFEARAAGADAALLIVRIIDDEARLKNLVQTATAIGLETIVEVHAAHEVLQAVAAGAKIIGINNRDLDTFDTRLEFSQEMAELMPPNVVKISESGIGRTADVTWLGDIGFAAVLVGESLMRGASILEALPRGRNR